MSEIWLLDDGRTFGGGQGNALRLGRFLSAPGSEGRARVYCPSSSELARRCGECGVPVFDARFPDVSPATAKDVVASLLLLRSMLKRATPNVIVVGGSLRAQFYAHAAGIGLRNAPPIVQFMIEQDSARRRLGRCFLRRAGNVVVLGDNALRAYTAALGRVRILKINNFLLEDDFSPKTLPREQTEAAPVLGVLGRLIPEKGVLELLEELAAIRSVWSQLVVAGPADDETYLRRVGDRVSSLQLDGAVEFVGALTDLRAFFEQIDVLLVPSVGLEGQPTVILEALAHGRPAVVRAPIWSVDFADLPVSPYRDSAELERRLAVARRAVVDFGGLRVRFGVPQAVAAFERVAADSRRRRRKRRT